MPSHEFREWQDRHKLSLTNAAKMLGLSRRMVQYHATGTKPIPKTIRLACIGAEAEMGRAGLPNDRKDRLTRPS